MNQVRETENPATPLRFMHQRPAAALRAESPDVDVVTHVGRAAGERDIETWRELTGGARTR